MKAVLVILLAGFLFHLLVWPSWKRARQERCSLKDCLVSDLTFWLCGLGWSRAAQWLMLHVPPTCRKCRAAAAACAAAAAGSREARAAVLANDLAMLAEEEARGHLAPLAPDDGELRGDALLSAIAEDMSMLPPRPPAPGKRKTGSS